MAFAKSPDIQIINYILGKPESYEYGELLSDQQ